MKKKIKHIWKYITSPRYRFTVDLMMSKESIDRQMNMMLEQIELSKIPPMYIEKVEEYKSGYGIGVLDAYEILKAKGEVL